MLPLFQIITPSSPSKIMPTNDIPTKPRRKKVDVPVHKTHDVFQEGRKKSFSANFNSKKHKFKHVDQDDPDFNQPIHTEVVVEIPDTDRSNKTSKKMLIKENFKLNNENRELVVKFNELEELSVRKITKLREKISGLQKSNEDIDNENNYLKVQYQNLMLSYEEVQKQLELSKFCKSCDDFKISIEEYSADNNLLRSSNKELNEDLNMLKTVVYRLNVQLERYQETLRKNNIRITKSTPIQDIIESQNPDDNISRNILSEVHQNHKHTAVSWGSVNAHTLGPLLDAYEDALKEKGEIIQNYEVEMSNFTGKLKQIISENEILYEKLTQDEGCSSKLKVELVNLKQELKSTREQNDLLIKKCALKQDKVEEILKVYETKVEQMRRDYNVIHEEYIKVRTENAALKEKSKALVDVQDDFRTQMHNYIPVSVHTASVNECKKWYEELKQQYEQEKEKLKENIDSQAKTINKLNGELSGLRNVREALQAKIAQLEKHIKKLESKCLELEHAVNEVQASRSALRKQLHKVMGFAKDMVAEQETLLKALNQRHLENKAVKRIGSDMATKMDSLKNQLKDVQKSAWQEFTTVEHKIQEQTELIEIMKEEHEKEIDDLKKIIKEQEETNLLLKSDLPKPHYLLYKDKYK